MCYYRTLLGNVAGLFRFMLKNSIKTFSKSLLTLLRMQEDFHLSYGFPKSRGGIFTLFWFIVRYVG